MRYVDITRDRLVTADSVFKDHFYTHAVPLTLNVFHAPSRIAVNEALCASYQPCQLPLKLDPLWSTHWFKIEATATDAMDGCEVHLLWDSTSEACVFDLSGRPLQGLTGSDRLPGPIRHEFILTRHAAPQTKFCYLIEVACNGLFGIHAFGTPTAAIGTLKQAEIAIFNRVVFDAYLDFMVIRDMGLHSTNIQRAAIALRVANEMLNLVLQLQQTTEAFQQVRKIAASFFAQKNAPHTHRVHALGHAHIDTAWLWPIAETKRKCVRTFSSAVKYMDDYPHYRFVCSQAQQLAWVEQNHPALFENIQAKVRSQQFLPVGGTWVEPDCNIPSGEALARQFLYGQQYFQKTFGRTSRVFWNPDVFGYCGNLPQLMKLSGIDFFLTQKLSWNQFNKIPASTFYWEGLDGSQVLTHFPPADTYTSVADAQQVVISQTQFKDADRLHHSSLLYGFGDGGGGPTPVMIEMLSRMRDVEGVPQVVFSTPEDFFEQSQNELIDANRVPLRWVGELYLEKHRGTYTTHAMLKKLSRQSEQTLFMAEWLQSLCFTRQKSIPCCDTVTAAWKNLLVNHFHDIIPGSSITEVFDDAVAMFDDIKKASYQAQKSCFELLTAKQNVQTKNIWVNATQWARTDVIGDVVVSMPPFGVCEPQLVSSNVFSPVTVNRLNDDTIAVTNQYFKATFNKSAQLVALHAIAADGTPSPLSFVNEKKPANQLALYADRPNRWDAWDVDAHYLETPLQTHIVDGLKIVSQSPLKVVLQATFQVGAQSRLVQTISVCATSKSIDVRHHVNWSEKHVFLRVLFPTTLRAHHALFGVQHGLVERPTHFNTSWDVARFEVPFQHWFSLGEPNRGLAILCRDKFGASAHASVLGLSLLRAPTWPDEVADQGEHDYSYAIYPFQGAFAEAHVPQQARLFATPLVVASSALAQDDNTFCEIDNPNILIDCLKVSENQQSIVLRCFESIGAHTPVHIKFKKCPKTATICNVLEQPDKPLAIQMVKSSSDITYSFIEVTLLPFQILSLSLTF